MEEPDSTRALPATPQRVFHPSQRSSPPPNPAFESPSQLSSSDIGEREETWAVTGGLEYWKRASDSMMDVTEVEEGTEELAEVDEPEMEEEEELAMVQDSQEMHTITASPSIARSSPPARARASHEPFSPIASTSRLSPEKLPPSPLRYPSISPFPSPGYKSSPLPSRSPTAAPRSQPAAVETLDIDSDSDESPTPTPEPQPEPQVEPEVFAQGRSFRTRTAAQLKPYSIENYQYTSIMQKQGWRGAIVAGPKIVEESAEELRRKKRLMESRPKDDLDGWLEFGEGQAVARDIQKRMEEEDEENAFDGETLLEREARRKDRLDRELLKAFNESGHGKKRADGGSREEGRDMEGIRRPKFKSNRARYGSEGFSGSQSDASDTSSDISSRLSKGKGRATSDKQSTSKGHRRSAGSDGDQRPKKVAKRAPRADSEPLSSSPASQRVQVRPSGTTKRLKKGSKDGVPKKQRTDRYAALDAQILELSSSSSRSGSGSEEEEEEEDESPNELSSSPEVRKVERTKLGGKRKRALGAMMPAVFMKKAQADLKLMQREKEEGMLSGSDLGSGDEEHLEKKNRAKKRVAPRLNDKEFIFDGATFTDESASDGGMMDSSTEEEEDTAVENWRRSFLQPKKGGGNDLIDKFLVNAKRASKKPKRKAQAQRTGSKGVGGGKQAGGGPREGGGQGRPKEKGKGKAGRQGSAGQVTEPVRRQPLQERDATRNSVPFERLPSVGNFGLSAEQQQEVQVVERWATYATKFTPDFQIFRLPSNIQFTSDSFVGKGHLYSLVSPPSPTPQARFSHPFDFGLRTDMPASEVEALIPQLCDCVFDGITTIVEAKQEGVAKFDGSSAEALRFLGYYITDFLASCDSESRTNFATLVKAQLKRLEDRLDHYAGKLEDSAEISISILNLQRVSLSWYILDINTRLLPFDTSSEQESLPQLMKELVGRLLRHGVEHTTKTLKNLVEAEADNTARVDDASVEVWLGLVCLALSPTVPFVSEPDLWQMVEQEVIAFATKGRSESTPIAGEAASYTAFMLCVVSQFAPNGRSSSLPRLSQHWSVVQRAIEVIKPAALSKVEQEVSNSALAKRDRYLWAIPARCLVFCERWGWKLRPSDSILTGLFDLFKARHLADLTIESNGDFPSFLTDAAENTDSTRYVKGDTAFNIFLKLINIVAGEIPESDYKRTVIRFFSRLTPMNPAPWTRASPQLSRGPSALTNHYSLLMTFTNLLPSTAHARLGQARGLLDFADAPDAARKICVRAIMYFAMIFKKHNVGTDPIVAWLADIAVQLRRELDDLQKQQQRGNSAHSKRTVEAMWNRTVLITMILRSAQVLMRWKKKADDPVAYPDVSLLNEAWTVQILTSTLALDPMVGREVMALITTFLDLRSSALPHRDADDGNGVSQDEFGMFENFDYDDPALNEMLGVEVEAAGPVSDLRTRDKATAKFLASSISPAFFKLVSNVFVASTADRDTPIIAVDDRQRYADQVVTCWVRCIAVMVENEESDWISYLQYGPNSWKRIPDPVGRRDIGLFLVINMFKNDPTILSQPACRDDILDVWFESIVSSKLSKQHDLLSILLNAEDPSPLFDLMPLKRDEVSGEFKIDAETLDSNRALILRRVFINAAKCFSPKPPKELPSQSAMMNLLRRMLASMRDNFAALSVEGQRKYSDFCRPVLSGLETCSPATFNGQSLTELPKLLISTAE